jgi:hypothetical protein
MSIRIKKIGLQSSKKNAIIHFFLISEFEGKASAYGMADFDLTIGVINIHL